MKDTVEAMLKTLENFCAVMIAFDEKTVREHPESDKVWFDGRIAGYQNVKAEIERILGVMK